jgi:pectate lyase
VGWAAVAGYDVETTTGGGDADPIVVSSFPQLMAAAAGDKPAVVHIDGDLSGDLTVGSNKT